VKCYVKKIFFIAAFACFCLNAAADDNVVFREMDINIGARAQAMGNAFTAVSDDSTAVFWNPGGLSRVRSAEVSLAYNSWFADTSIQYLTGSMSLGRNSGAGAGIVFVNMGEIELIEDDGYMPGNTVRPFSLIAAAGYGAAVFDYYNDIMKNKPDIALSLGMTGKILLSNDGENVSHGMFLDMGGLLQFGESLEAGISLRNLGAVSAGTSPLAAGAGVSYRLMNDRINRAICAIEANYGVEGILKLSAGAEYAFASSFFARAGYEWRSNYQTSSGTLSGLNAGIGIKLQSFAVDYSIRFNGGLGASHAFGLTYIMK